MGEAGWDVPECAHLCVNLHKGGGCKGKRIKRREKMETAVQADARGWKEGSRPRLPCPPWTAWGRHLETTSEGSSSTLTVGSPTQATGASVESFSGVLFPRWRHFPRARAERKQPYQLSGIHRQFPGLLLRTGSLNTYFSVTSLTVTFGGQQGGV